MSSYVKLPLAPVSDVLPRSLFVDPTTPQYSKAWITDNIPIMHWHITHFKEHGREYTCIGVSLSHAIFDGIGIAAVVHALEAETLGQEWTVPPTLKAGTNENPMQVFLDQTKKEMEAQNKYQLLPDYQVCIISIKFVLFLLVWFFWQQFWHKARSQMILIPPKVYEQLREAARNAVSVDGKDDVRLSTGDVLSAWLFKVRFFCHPILEVNRY